MKNILVALFLLSNFVVFGQNPDANKEAYITYGTFFLNTSSTSNDGNSSRSDAESEWPMNFGLTGLVDFPADTQYFLGSKGNFTVGLNFRLGDTHVVGGMFNFDRHNTNLLVGNQNWSESNIKNYTLSARYDYRWVSNEKLKLYSGISAGAGIRRTQTKYFDVSTFGAEFPEIEQGVEQGSTDFGYHLHLNGFGLRYGKDWAIMLELGYGTRGYVNVGINHFLFATDKWIKE